MKKFVSLVLALAMILSLCACGDKPTPTPDGSKTPDQTPSSSTGTGDNATPVLGEYVPVTYNEDELYDAILGEFNEIYQQAKSESNVSKRWALMAVAEAKLMGAGTTSFTICKGGNYSISRLAPGTISSILFGNDSDRFHNAVVVDKFIPADQVAEMRAKWNELRGTGTYEEWVKGYLTEKGYQIKDTYNWNGYDGDAETWDILASSQATDAEFLVNTFDGLMEYDIENVQQPALATSVEQGETTALTPDRDEEGNIITDEDGNIVMKEVTVPTYTFHIREGAVWTDSQGRKVADVQADDWVAGMEHLYDANGGLEDLLNGIILNGTEYNLGEITDFSMVGVKALDKYTVQYTLAAPCPFFMTMMGYSIFAPMSREYFTSQGGKFGALFDAAASDYNYGKGPDSIAYCGPYLVSSYTPKNSIVFSANPSYWNADGINIKTITWPYNDGSDATKAYEDAKSGLTDGTGLSATSLELARAETLSGDDATVFDKYAYNSNTDATTYFGWLNVNRRAFANYNDDTKLVSTQSHGSADAIDPDNEVYTSDIVDDTARAHVALNNRNFRLAINLCVDRGAYNSLRMGEDLKFANLINSVVPGDFCYLEEDVTIDINGKETTFPAGTAYGEIVQTQIEADGLPMVVFDRESGKSTGYDGWYHLSEAQEYMEKAVEELLAQGVEITKENPIILDTCYYSGSEFMTNQANLLKQTYESAFDGLLQINLYPAAEFDEYNRATYYPESGAEMNYDLAYGASGWGPDWGEPSTWLDCFQPFGEGYMVKSMGLY